MGASSNVRVKQGRHLFRERQFLRQPTGRHVLDRGATTVHQPQRTVVDPGEIDATTADELGEPVWRREYHVVTGGGKTAGEGDKGLHVAAGAQRQDENLYRAPSAPLWWRSW